MMSTTMRYGGGGSVESTPAKRVVHLLPKSFRSPYSLPGVQSTSVFGDSSHLTSSTLLTPLPKKKFHYYSPSQPKVSETEEKDKAALPRTAREEELAEAPIIEVRRRPVQLLDMKKVVSVPKKMVQNEQYRDEVQAKLRVQTRMQELERQRKFKSNYTSYSTSFARSSNTSSMSYNRNKPRNTVRVIRRLREERKHENRKLAQGMRREISANLNHSKSQLKEAKLKLAEIQRKDNMENEHYVSEARIRVQEDTTATVQGQKMVHDVLSSLIQSDLNFAKRFQNLNNMLYTQVRQQRQKLSRKEHVKHNKERVTKQNCRTKAAHERARAAMNSRMSKIKKETEMQQEMINTTLTNRKEILRRKDLAIKARIKHDFDLHQALNPGAFVTTTEREKEKRIPWAGATSRRIDVFIDQTNKKLLPLTQVVSASEAMEDPDL